MQITVIDVGQPNTHATKNGRSYQSMEVTYKNDSGQVQSKKLMSFSNPDVFKQAKDWQKGDTVDINTQKDDNGYWQWISIGADAIAQASSSTSNTSSKTTRVTGSNYETKEERAQRQVMIVRQSSISSAISALTAEGKRPSVADILGMAKEFENYVMDNPSVTLETMEDDIPL